MKVAIVFEEADWKFVERLLKHAAQSSGYNDSVRETVSGVLARAQAFDVQQLEEFDLASSREE